VQECILGRHSGCLRGVAFIASSFGCARTQVSHSQLVRCAEAEGLVARQKLQHKPDS